MVVQNLPDGRLLDIEDFTFYLYLLITNVSDLVLVSVAAPIGNSDHSFLSAVISMAQAVPNLCVSRNVFLKHQVNWNTVCGVIQDLRGCNIWHADNPAAV